MVNKFPPHTEATALGHLDLTPWRRKDVPQEIPIDPNEVIIADEEDTSRNNVICLAPFKPEELFRNHTDLLGRFPHTSEQGNFYIMVQYCTDADYIHWELMKDREESSYADAFLRGYEFFKNRGLPPWLLGPTRGPLRVHVEPNEEIQAHPITFILGAPALSIQL
jgi:hypothetical protein